MKLSKKLQAESQSEKDMYQKMLGQKPPAKTNKQSENSSSVVRQFVFLSRQFSLFAWIKINTRGFETYPL